MIEEFAFELKKLLQKQLPGDISHQKMMSYKRTSVKEVLEQNTYRQSAVLVLFYPFNSEIYLAFMLRPTYDGVHSGQVCFPGGRREDIDRDLNDTALREANEELNIQKEKVNIIGKLSPIYVPPSNFLIQPIVGYTVERPHFLPDKKEVDALIEVPVEELRSSKNLQKAKVKIQNNIEIEVPGFVIQEHLIWGATSMIVMELIDIIQEIKTVE